MNTIRIPHGLRELFGEESTPAELSVVSGFAVVSTVAAMWTTGNEWLGLGTFAAILIALLMVDIYGGVIANLSVGTNRYYGHSKKRRLIFIAVHVQPMLFALIEGDPGGGRFNSHSSNVQKRRRSCPPVCPKRENAW